LLEPVHLVRDDVMDHLVRGFDQLGQGTKVEQGSLLQPGRLAVELRAEAFPVSDKHQCPLVEAFQDAVERESREAIPLPEGHLHVFESGIYLIGRDQIVFCMHNAVHPTVHSASSPNRLDIGCAVMDRKRDGLAVSSLVRVRSQVSNDSQKCPSSAPDTMVPMATKLLSFEFISLTFVSFFAFCNMAVFYGFYSYLGRMGIPAEWRGFLVGLEPMTAFALRLVLVPLVHAGNAVVVMLGALVMLAMALNAYTWAMSIETLAVLRVFHGAAFVLLVSAGMVLVVQFIPKEKSAQGFGVVSLASLIPYAVMPVLAEQLLGHGIVECRVYAMVSVMALPGIILLASIKRRVEATLRERDRIIIRRPSARELLENLREWDVLLLLGVNVLIYISHASVFYFMKNLFHSLDFGDVSGFFTVSSVVMIVVRVLGGGLFDRLNKTRVTTVFLLILAALFVLFSRVESLHWFTVLAGLYGLCLGVIMPLLNATMFAVSPPHLRGANTNLSLFMMDAGYFLSPYLGGALLASGWPVASLFQICTLFLLLSVALFGLLRTKPAAC
jgi:MFS family permease